MNVENSNLYATMVPKPIWGAPGMVGLHWAESALWIRVIMRDNLELFNSFQYPLTSPDT